MQTILGANGIIATELAKELYSKFTKNIRLVSRNPKQVNGTDQLFSADLLNATQTQEAVKGSEIVYLTVGLPNNSQLWKEQFPIIMRNVIDACIHQKAKLVFFDNTYMYGKTEGLITEGTPFLATGIKGKARGKTANMLLDEIKKNTITAMICRAPEFYGPRNTIGITNAMIFENIKKSKKLRVVLRDDTLRTLIYTPDAGKATAWLANQTDTYNQTWHLPCDTNRLTSKQFIQLISSIYGKELSYMIVKGWMLKLAGLFNPNAKEVIELLYRYETDNLFDCSKFMKRFPDFKVSTYREGLSEIINEIKR